MLFKNDEPMRLDDMEVKDTIVIAIRKEMEEIRDTYKFPIRIKTKYGTRINPTGHKEPNQSIVALLEGNYMLPNGGKVRIRYSKMNPRKMSNGRIEYVEGSGEVIERNMVIGSDDLDKAWFMLKVCPVVKKGMMKVEDKQKEAKAKLDSLGNMAVVNYLLADKASELASDHERVRTLALSFGVANADDTRKLSIEEVKVRLITNIAKGEASKDPIINVKNFKESITIPLETQKRAIVQQAIDKEILYFNHTKYYWAIKLSGLERKLLDVDGQSFGRKEDILVKHLLVNDDARELFDKAMGRYAAFAGKKDFTAEEIDSMSMADVRSRCQEVNIPAFGKGRTEDILKKELKEHYNV